MTITIQHRATKGRRVHVRTPKHTNNPIHQATCATCWDKLTNDFFGGLPGKIMGVVAAIVAMRVALGFVS